MFLRLAAHQKKENDRVNDLLFSPLVGDSVLRSTQFVCIALIFADTLYKGGYRGAGSQDSDVR